MFLRASNSWHLPGPTFLPQLYTTHNASLSAASHHLTPGLCCQYNDSWSSGKQWLFTRKARFLTAGRVVLVFEELGQGWDNQEKRPPADKRLNLTCTLQSQKHKSKCEWSVMTFQHGFVWTITSVLRKGGHFYLSGLNGSKKWATRRQRAKVQKTLDKLPSHT